MTASRVGQQGLPAFSLLAAPGSGTTPVLGLWAPTRTDAPIAFGPVAGAGPTEPTWRATLPEDTVAADFALEGAEQVVVTAERTLPVAAARLTRLVASRQGEAAYAVLSAAQAWPETALKNALDEVARLDVGEVQVSFGAGAEGGGVWSRAVEGFRDYCAQLRGLIARESWVETETGGCLLARTALGRGGSAVTAWRASVGPADGALHGRTVALALATREGLLRTLALATRGAGLLAMTTAGPGGVLLALPAAWQFVEDVRAEAGAARAKREEVRDGQ